jgi:hypothetical protein
MKNVRHEISAYIETEVPQDVIHSKRWGKILKLKT